MDDSTHSLEAMPSTSTTLVRRLQKRQPRAWTEAVSLYGPLVYGWCRRGGLQGADARDVTQEVFRVLSEQIDRFRVDESDSSFRGWLRTVTRWRLSDHFRTQSRLPARGGTSLRDLIERQPDPDPSHGDDSDAPSSSPALELLERARSECSDQAWQAFWRTQFDGLSGAEVAEELGCSVHAVYMARSRIMARLRELGGDRAQD